MNIIIDHSSNHDLVEQIKRAHTTIKTFTDPSMVHSTIRQEYILNSEIIQMFLNNEEIETPEDEDGYFNSLLICATSDQGLGLEDTKKNELFKVMTDLIYDL